MCEDIHNSVRLVSGSQYKDITEHWQRDICPLCVWFTAEPVQYLFGFLTWRAQWKYKSVMETQWVKLYCIFTFPQYYGKHSIEEVRVWAGHSMHLRFHMIFLILQLWKATICIWLQMNRNLQYWVFSLEALSQMRTGCFFLHTCQFWFILPLSKLKRGSLS